MGAAAAGLVLVVAALSNAACGAPASEPVATRLVVAFDPDAVQGTASVETPTPTVWRFDGEDGVAGGANGNAAERAATFGWTALHGVDGLRVADGTLRGTTGEHPFVAVRRPEGMDTSDLVHGVEIRIRVSAGANLGVSFVGDEEVNVGMLVAEAEEGGKPALQMPLRESDELETYTLTSADATFLPSFSLGAARHIIVVPSDAEGAEFEIESVRLITRREHLASIESGVGWQGLAEVYRESIVSRAPEQVSLGVDVPADAYLDLTIGTIESAPVTFVVRAGDNELLRRTITTPHRWEPAPVDLSAVRGATTLTLALEAGNDGTIGFWGSPVVRRRAATPPFNAGNARAALAGAPRPPRAVILFIADTLRKDHLTPWGGERDNAPTLARLASEGTRFADNISQGTWTKVAVPSILTSLYPSTHGIVDLPDRMPSSAVTIEEVFQEAGYATFHTSSVPFTGRLTNLHQGVEVLHETSSLGDLGHSSAKTARTYVDRFLDWLDGHADVPFFAMVHVFDPHSPYRPYPPYDTLYNSADDNTRYEADLATADAHMESAFMKSQGLPSTDELAAAGIDVEPFLAHQRAWYDASIRAMDEEIARLMERLEQLGLADDTLIAFIADHGEEFQEHGRPWHGLNIYGYMINTPMMLWWPGVVPGGLVIDETTQSIDLTPTLIDLAGLEIPEILQGQSMVPLLAQPDNPEALGWEWRPAFAERMRIPGEVVIGPDIDSYAIVAGGWKLIHNVANLPDGWPEYELYDHVQDPLNLDDVADANPDVVQTLAARLNEVRQMAEAARLSDEDLAGEMDAETLQRLRALGYIR